MLSHDLWTSLCTKCIQCFIKDVLRDFLSKFVRAYIDHTLICSQSKGQHVSHLKAMLNNLLCFPNLVPRVCDWPGGCGHGHWQGKGCHRVACTENSKADAKIPGNCKFPLLSNVPRNILLQVTPAESMMSETSSYWLRREHWKNGNTGSNIRSNRYHPYQSQKPRVPPYS